jgi:hypothetical protein
MQCGFSFFVDSNPGPLTNKNEEICLKNKKCTKFCILNSTIFKKDFHSSSSSRRAPIFTQDLCCGSYIKFSLYSGCKFYLCIPACKCVRLLILTRYKLFREIFFFTKRNYIFKLSIFAEKLSNFTSFSE